jgi:hypothetical protein
MKKYQLTKFKLNNQIASEVSDLKLELGPTIKSVNYPSILLMISENHLTGFDEVKLTKLTSDYIKDNTNYLARIIIPITGGSDCVIRFEDNTEFSLSHPVVIEDIKYEIAVPVGVELVLMSMPIDYNKSLAKYTPAERRLEIFAHSML